MLGITSRGSDSALNKLYIKPLQTAVDECRHKRDGWEQQRDNVNGIVYDLRTKIDSYWVQDDTLGAMTKAGFLHELVTIKKACDMRGYGSRIDCAVMQAKDAIYTVLKQLSHIDELMQRKSAPSSSASTGGEKPATEKQAEAKA